MDNDLDNNHDHYPYYYCINKFNMIERTMMAKIIIDDEKLYWNVVVKINNCNDHDERNKFSKLWNYYDNA